MKFVNDVEQMCFDDVLLIPQFSMIESRKDVSLDTNFLGLNLKNPIISSNMDSVTGFNLANAMSKNGALSCLHRFQTIQENVNQYYNSVDLMAQTHDNIIRPIVSIGVGGNEFERALALSDAGATHFLIDVAHGASMQAVNQYDRLRARLNDNVAIIIGNFATKEGIRDFVFHTKSKRKPNAFKVGIGGGSACTTRIVSGSGFPTFSSIISCSSSGFPIIADGGIRNSGDYAKALAAGASLVMVGRMLAGTDESPGELTDWMPYSTYGGQTSSVTRYKAYRGSASAESYEVQGKTAQHRTPEGESMLVPYIGPVRGVLDSMAAGLRSAMTYSGAKNLQEFREKALFSKVSHATMKESIAHGKDKT